MNNCSGSGIGTNQQADPSAKFVGTAKLNDIDFSIEAKSDNIYDGIELNLNNGYETSVRVSNSWDSEVAVVILTDTEGKEYQSKIDWTALFHATHGNSPGSGFLNEGSEYSVKVTFDNLPSGTVADSITIENIMTFKTARNPKSVIIDNTIPDVEQKKAKEASKEETAGSSAEPVESMVSQTETSQKPSEASKEETAESSAEKVESKVSQAEVSQSTSEPSKTESKTSSTEQPVKTSSGFKGSTRIEKYNFTIDANSDNIYDGITLHFKNEGDDRVFVETKWMSYKIDAVLTDTNGKEYEESVSAYMFSLIFGDEKTINIQFENLPEGITAETITIKYLGTQYDFSDSSYLDKVSTAVIQNNS